MKHSKKTYPAKKMTKTEKRLQRLAPNIPCPRCEGQRYDKDNCSLCGGTGLASSPAVRPLKPFQPLKLDGLPSDDAQFGAEGFQQGVKRGK